MRTNVSLFRGDNDWLATPQDIKEGILPKVKSIIYDEELSSWNHLDFVWGVKANTLIYKKIIENVFERT